MKKMLKIAGSVLFAILLLGTVLFGVYWYRNIHWYDKYEKSIAKVNAVEKQVTLPSGNVINYGEVDNNKPVLLLIHGQMGSWEDYALVMPELSEKWHIFAIDVYGHGESTHDESLYYIDINGNDIIWFIDNIIGEPTVISGHSNGALTAAYVAAYGEKNIKGVILEDPPVFSTEGENWEKSFAYLDTYKTLHDYNLSDKSECWEAYYLRHCYWGQLFMKDSMDGIANYAEKYYEKHPNEYVKIGFLTSTVWSIFKYAKNYDFAYGEHFYNLSWNHGISQKQILTNINVPCIYIHAKEGRSDNGTYLCAASRAQAERAVGYIGENCKLLETNTSDHIIHTVHKDFYIATVNSLLEE